MPQNTEACVFPLMWDRERYNKKLNKVNHGVDYSIHGHNSTPEPIWIGNSLHIDTNYYSKPTLFEISLILEK